MRAPKKLVFICRHCDGEMRCTAEGFQENPFCGGCLHERLQLAVAARGPGKMVVEGGYTWFVPDPLTDSGG
jgi:hypothetical protein